MLSTLIATGYGTAIEGVEWLTGLHSIPRLQDIGDTASTAFIIGGLLLLFVYILFGSSDPFGLQVTFSMLRNLESNYVETSKQETPMTKPVGRELGKWVPQDYAWPTPEPYKDWDVHTTTPLPYRPFRYGPNYYQTMGIRRLAFDDWVECDRDWLKYHNMKKARLLEREGWINLLTKRQNYKMCVLV